LYIDMNGLIHPCCHDTAPLPEPASEEEMFQRMFEQMDLLVRTVRPKKCLVLTIDGVAPRSKMNQQRARRFRAATERRENAEIAQQMVNVVVQNHKLPQPIVPKARWDHNVITPSTPFMERVAAVLEWYIVSRLNTDDPIWRELTVVLSDAHVPGEGEHKIMHYIRSLRAEPDYDPNTSHLIQGMDADLICLGLSTHEANVGILRNVMNRETFKPEPNRFCVFNLRTFRNLLHRDFGAVARKSDFERVIDDFVFLCFFIGNDFLPHMPLVDIKCRGIETMLDHYVRNFDDFGHLTRGGLIVFTRLRTFLEGFVSSKMDTLLELKDHKVVVRERAQRNLDERIELLRQSMRHALSQLAPDRSNAVEVSQEVFRCYVETTKEQTRFVGGKFPLPFEYGAPGYRDAYYRAKMGFTLPEGTDIDPAAREAFEADVERCCREYLRGMQWVMRYYTVGCPSWEWFYPYYYAPLLEDVVRYCHDIDDEMRLGEPLHPVEQLLAVMPRESYHALPAELHDHIRDTNSKLAPFYPKEMHVDVTESTVA
jgi:5'-3' exoribonuclease 2